MFDQFLVSLDPNRNKNVFFLTGLGLSLNDNLPQELGYLAVMRVKVEKQEFLQKSPLYQGTDLVFLKDV